MGHNRCVYVVCVLTNYINLEHCYFYAMLEDMVKNIQDVCYK